MMSKLCKITVCSLLLSSAFVFAEKPQMTPAQRQQAFQQSLLRNVNSHIDVTYATVDGRELKLDLYLPKTAKKPLPLVVWIHGGAWRSGSKTHCPALLMTRTGFAAASISYRLSPEAMFPAQVQDCKAAIRFLRANADKYGIDPDAFGVWGGSAGAHLAAMLGVSAGIKEADGSIGDYTDVSTEVQAVCDWFGPTDFMTLPMESHRLKDGDTLEVQLFGGRISEKQDLAKLVSPATHVSQNDPPFLIMHGREDPLVPVQQSQLLHDKLLEAGIASELIILSGQGHGFDNPLVSAKPVVQFFTRHLKKTKINPRKLPAQGDAETKPDIPARS